MELFDEEIKYMFLESPSMAIEFDSEFLGFSQLYAAASRVLPRSARIVDIGCGLGFQARFFSDFAGYTGVDLPRHQSSYEKNAWDLFGESMPGEYIEDDGINYMSNLIWTEGWEGLENTLVIVSAVPGQAVPNMARRLFPNTLIWFPGEEIDATGKWADMLLDELEDSFIL